MNINILKQSTLLVSVLVFLCCSEVNSSENIFSDDYPIRISKNYPMYYEKSTGETWIPNAINYLPYFIDNNDTAACFQVMEDYFRKFAENGGNAIRICLSTPFLEIEDTNAGEYNPAKFERIDKLLELAEKYKIYVKFTLLLFRSINPSNEAVAQGWANSIPLSQVFNDIIEYTTTPKGIQYYLNRARALSARYKDCKQIYCWELWNEMDAVPGNTWPTFTPPVIDSIKAIFPNRLVVQTLGGLHSYVADQNYKTMFSYPNNDFVSIHRYLEQGNEWGQYDCIKGDIDTLVSTAMDFVHRYVSKKPIVFNEIGAVEPNHVAPSKLYKIDKEGVLLHDMLFAPFFCGSAGAGAMWHWDSYLYANDLWYHYRRFTNAIEGIDPVKERFTPSAFETNGVRCYALNGRFKTMIWGRDTGSNWRTELEQGIPAQTKENVKIRLEQLKNKKYKSARIYDPWKDRWQTAEIKNGEVVIPPFIRSFVVVFQ